MLGIPDPGIWLAMLLCILSTIACVIYGAVKWNADDDSAEDVSQWAKEEKELEEEL